VPSRGSFPPTWPASSNKSCLRAYISLCGTLHQRMSDCYYSTVPTRYFSLRELNFTLLSPYLPEGYGVEDRDKKHFVNVLVIPVNSSRVCFPRSNLNLVKHVWETYMFSFNKYASLIFPSLERAVYIRNAKAESDGLLSPACSLCKGNFESLYRYRAKCVRPTQHEFHCTVCARRHPTLKGTASDVAFRYVLNLEAFWMDSRVT
jgi:hypothetical protein